MGIAAIRVRFIKASVGRPYSPSRVWIEHRSGEAGR
jgi:hypothetical protein